MFSKVKFAAVIISALLVTACGTTRDISHTDRAMLDRIIDARHSEVSCPMGARRTGTAYANRGDTRVTAVVEISSSGSYRWRIERTGDSSVARVGSTLDHEHTSRHHPHYEFGWFWPDRPCR